MGSCKKQPLFQMARKIAGDNGSLYRDGIKDRDELIAFMDINEWFHLDNDAMDGDFMVEMPQELVNSLDLWLKAYKKSGAEKTELLMGLLEERFPNTGRRFRSFMETSDRVYIHTAWKVLDLLLGTLRKEADEYTEEEINDLVTSAYGELRIQELELLSSFLSYRCEDIPLTEWQYRFKSHQMVKPDRSAYGIEDFSLMAYMVFNSQAWEDNHLVEKALANPRQAQLWTFCAFHFICALRNTDIERLPVPALPYDPETVRQKICDGSFAKTEAYAIAYELEFRCHASGRRPHKTLQKCIAPEIKLFIPESLMAPLGYIMAISLSYRNHGDPFVAVDFDLRDIVHFFGEDFARAAGYKSFGSRKANRSYMQGIEASSDDEPGKPKGYMLASLARSHKGGIGKLSDVTDVYLRDAAFTGMDPDFIILEMFERGVFGFIPCMLLETCEGDRFRKLDVHGQTELIKVLGIDAWQIESVADAVELSYKKAGMIVKSVIDEAGEEKTGDVLKNIAAGTAVSKQKECLCLRKAAGLGCVNPGYGSCIGCGCEIYTKSAMHMMVKEYARLARLTDDPVEGERDRQILKRFIIPSIVQMLKSIETLYPDADMDILRKIIERGMADADNC